MKTEKSLWDSITLELVKFAAKKACKNKAKRKDVIEFKKNFDLNCDRIYKELLELDFSNISYNKFIKHSDYGKERRISSADLNTRVKMHVWMILGHKRFVQYDPKCSYNCKEGYGLNAKDKNKSLVRSMKHIFYDCRDVYYWIKLDIYHCYETSKKKTFLKALKSMYSDPNYIYAADKLVFYENKLPIGTPTSPTSHHIMMFKLDHFIKNDLRIKHYVRYADDMFIGITEGKSQMHEVYWRIRNFCYYELGYYIKLNTKRCPIRIPCDIGGYVFNRIPNKKITEKNKGFARIRKRTKKAAYKAKSKESLISYYSMLLHGDCVNLTNKIFMDFKELLPRIKVSRRMEAEQINLKDLLDKTFDIVDFETREPTTSKGNIWFRMLVGFPEQSLYNRKLVKMVTGESEAIYLVLKKLSELQNSEDFKDKRILPITDVTLDKDKRGYLFKGSIKELTYLNY